MKLQATFSGCMNNKVLFARNILKLF